MGIPNYIKFSTTYCSWSNMKTRCFNSNKDSYKHYGGRGITVCNHWLKFDNFLEDMGERPDGMTLDRIDNDGNYKPSNCQWATQKQQCRNKRGNRIMFLEEQSHCLREWADILKVSYGLLENRIRRGWTDYQTLTIPKGGRRCEK
ncbi:hypothetical protein LCGC14_1617290 [marine sediment metagenome]|uniref:Uncharacterized protein n=1 Tax=marine sediment metagenome TaxID=412755 RepID=A0A0F9KM28_9ZZZZ